jgi:hypothetical protein
MRTKLLFVMTCCLLALPAAASADEVRITDPVGGTYKNGAVLTIKWDYTFLEHYPKTADEKKMEIYLRNYDTSMWLGQLTTVDVLSRGYTWAIMNVPPGRYMLYFWKESEPARGTCAISEVFTIEQGTGRFFAVPTTGASIRITSPVGGRSYYIGSTMHIQWDTSLIANQRNIWLQICWPDGKPAAGAYPAPNTGSYDWTIGETAENSLKVCITTMDEKLKGMSGTFSVKFPLKLKRAMPGPLRTFKK